MKRIERLTPHDDFLVSMFQDDPRLLEMFKQAELERWARWKNAWQILGAWLGLLAVAGIIWVGVLKAIGAW